MDQQIVCTDCGNDFVFTVAEQEFYEERGLAAPPKRCKDCRQMRKAGRVNNQGGYGRGAPPPRYSGGPNDYRGQMGDGYGGPPPWDPRGGHGGYGPPPPQGPRGGWGGPPPQRQPHNPRGHNPYGPPPPRNDGWNQGRQGGGHDYGPPQPYREPPPYGGGWGGQRYPEPSRGASQQQHAFRAERVLFDVTCAECGTHAQVPFRPIEGRQVFCQPCYRARRGMPRDTGVMEGHNTGIHDTSRRTSSHDLDDVETHEMDDDIGE